MSEQLVKTGDKGANQWALIANRNGMQVRSILAFLQQRLNQSDKAEAQERANRFVGQD